MDKLLIAIEALHFASAMLLAGALFLRLYAGGEAGEIAIPPRALLLGGAVAGLLTGLVWLAFEAGEMGNGWADTINPITIGSVIADTVFGQVWLGRMGLAAILVGLTLFPGGPRGGIVLFVAAAIFLASLALIGHAIMRSGALGIAQIANQCAHLLAGGAWLGGLPMLAIALRREGAESAKILILRRFSVMGLIAVPILLLTGLFNSVLQLGSFKGLATPYGQVLEVKLALVLAMLLLASINRLIFLPRATPAIAAIRKAALVEMVLGAAVLTVASLLGSLQPPFLG